MKKIPAGDLRTRVVFHLKCLPCFLSALSLSLWIQVDTFNGGPGPSSRHRWKDRNDPSANSLRAGSGSGGSSGSGSGSWKSSSSSLLGGLLSGSSSDNPSELGELQRLDDGSSSGSGGGGRRETPRNAGPSIEFYACASTPEDDVRSVRFEICFCSLSSPSLVFPFFFSLSIS